ncbi:hypothetical protein FGO68_gene6990 [Halteria grandinella]|uniref:Uncharacterized protein n=1 Tax=Halteria grandinella TaxID=5974 RepID=A0A8J8NEK9_HALGN|nr:hypothetical protein FGO68_gene6990 [Halteria grandinella]
MEYNQFQTNPSVKNYQSNPFHPAPRISPKSNENGSGGGGNPIPTTGRPDISFLGNLDPNEIPLAMEKMGKENMEKLLELRKQYEQCYKLALEYQKKVAENQVKVD